MKRQIARSSAFISHIKGFVMKLRLTGFESHRIFVIRLSLAATPFGVGPAIDTAAGLGISLMFDEFPKYCFDVVWETGTLSFRYIFTTQI